MPLVLTLTKIKPYGSSSSLISCFFVFNPNPTTLASPQLPSLNFEHPLANPVSEKMRLLLVEEEVVVVVTAKLVLVLSILFSVSFSKEAAAEPPAAAPKSPFSHITVIGFVYCDICSNNTFSKHSYFLPGAQVKIDCIFKALSSSTSEQISFSVKRYTNKFGYYQMEVPSVDGIQCAEESSALLSTCQVTLVTSSSESCNVPGYRTTTDQIAVISKRTNECIYSLTALNFRPRKRDIALCG